MSEPVIPEPKQEDTTVLETNVVVRILWNILFACFYPFIITFSLIVSGIVLTISFIGNLILRLFRK
jgi:hypothetical protein